VQNQTPLLEDVFVCGGTAVLMLNFGIRWKEQSASRSNWLTSE